MSAEIVPFGKYKGQPIAALAQDREYCEWLSGQDWFRTRFSGIHTLIVNNFGAPAETPEHNALQAKFTDAKWRAMAAAQMIDWPSFEWFLKTHSTCNEHCCSDGQDKVNRAEALALRKTGVPASVRIRGLAFEDHGADVVLDCEFTLGQVIDRQEFRIECKPSLGDDYPAVLRQMKAHRSNVLVIGDGGYTGTGATREQIEAIFGTAKIKIVLCIGQLT